MHAGRVAMSRWLEDGWRESGCTALFAQNDDTAWGAIEALRAAGFRVPDDVSVIGFDGTQSAMFCNPKLTTVEVPLQQMGREAVRLLLRRLACGRHSVETRFVETLVFPTQLKVRASTAAV